MFFHMSGALAGTVKSSGNETIRSGVPIFHLSSSNLTGGGISAGFPFGAPASAHWTMVEISFVESPPSFLNVLMPTFGSTYHGGIIRKVTFSLIAFAHGRSSSYVSNDMGAMAFGR